MNEKHLDIINLIENNPITRLSQTYNNKLINKIKKEFTETQQQLFVSSFYCYLQYHPTNDYVVDLDNIWKWMGFSTKQKAKMLLEQQFMKEKDYNFLLNLKDKQKDHIRGGYNKQTFLLNIRTFKLFCIKAGTQKANEIHEYFVRLEDILHQVVQEETDELKTQLQEKTKELECKINKTKKEKETLREKTILEQFEKNVQCIYYGYIDDTNEKKEKLIKFGQTNDLCNRVKQHKTLFMNFCLVNAFRVDNKQLIENEIKNHKVINIFRRNIIINNINQTEILAINNGLTVTELDMHIKNIILSNEFTKENFTKLLEENIKIKDEILLLREENEKLQIYNKKLIKNYRSKIISKHDKHVEILANNNDDELLVMHSQYITNNEKLQYDVVINPHPVCSHSRTTECEYTPSCNGRADRTRYRMEVKEVSNDDIDNTKFDVIKILTKFSKQKDGYYHVDGKKYKLLFGSREQVWNEAAYKTTGGLKKNDLLVNKYGKIVSKVKYIQSKNEKRLDDYNNKRKLICNKNT